MFAALEHWQQLGIELGAVKFRFPSLLVLKDLDLLSFSPPSPFLQR